MIPLMIPSSDVYMVEDKEYFRVRVKGIEGNTYSFHITYSYHIEIPTKLEEIDVCELKCLAKLCEIKGYSNLSKDELIELLAELVVFPSCHAPVMK